MSVDIAVGHCHATTGNDVYILGIMGNHDWVFLGSVPASIHGFVGEWVDQKLRDVARRRTT